MQSTIANNQCAVKPGDLQADRILHMLRDVADTEHLRTFGQQLRFARNEQRMEQKELAKLLHVSTMTIRRLEHDQAPPGDYLPALARIFPERREWFLTNEELRGELLELRDKVEKLTEVIVKHFGPDAL